MNNDAGTAANTTQMADEAPLFIEDASAQHQEECMERFKTKFINFLNDDNAIIRGTSSTHLGWLDIFDQEDLDMAVGHTEADFEDIAKQMPHKRVGPPIIGRVCIDTPDIIELRISHYITSIKKIPGFIEVRAAEGQRKYMYILRRGETMVKSAAKKMKICSFLVTVL